MGKGRRNKPKKNFAEKRREKKQKKNEWKQNSQESYADIIRENKDFEHYYKTQNVVPPNEWDAFLKRMKENLPVAFRITGSKSETNTLLEIIKGDLFKQLLNANLENSELNTEKRVVPHCLPFYPDELAWQLQLTRKDIRRSEAFHRLHNFLIMETSTGNISRQEVVSMIPPLVLDVKPWHKVLDMCAAPGSKTAQLIEMIHADEKIPIPEGFVIANDLDNNRCYMLVHQAKRLNSPNILITNHDSSVMPNFVYTQQDGKKSIVKFDRILADVPCSGDGTMRKNPDIWCKWSAANGNNLHGIQYRIAKRGVELLAVGGKMVYSTCSLNPVENEAVLCRLLSETGDSVRLIDGKDLVPGLVYNSGVTTWQVASKNLQYYKTYEEVPEQWQTQIRPKMFPPSPEEIGKYNLEKCMRILPHHQDTGGFFVAVLEKVKPLPWESETDNTCEISIIDEKTDDKPWGPQRKRRKIHGYREDPFVFFSKDNELWPLIKEFYDISDSLDPRCLLVRCAQGKKKNIYFTSPAIRDIVICNENRVKMINTGVKTFVRCDNKNMACAFRLAQEGLLSIVNFIGNKRKININKEDLIRLLQNTDHHAPPEITDLTPETKEQLDNFGAGSCVLVYKETNTNKSFPLKLEMVGWRGTMSFRAYVSVHDATHYLRLLGADCSMFEKNKFEINRNLNSQKSNSAEDVKDTTIESVEAEKNEVNDNVVEVCD